VVLVRFFFSVGYTTNQHASSIGHNSEKDI